MAGKIISNKAVRDIFITLAGLVTVWVILQGTLGVTNPFYVVSSGSMVPELEVNDIIVIQGKNSIDDVKVGDIIVFDRPSDHERVIVHRVVSITSEDPTVLRTKGDANAASIPGTDYPITQEEYIGTVIVTVPQLGYVTKILMPPTNYIIMGIIISIMVAKHFLDKKKKEAKSTIKDVTDTKLDGELEEDSKIETPDGDFKVESEHVLEKNDKAESNVENTKSDNVEEKKD